LLTKGDCILATFTNRATLTYNGTVVNSNTVTGEIREVLSATKRALVDTYTVDDTVTYIVSLVNTGSEAYTDLTVTDDLGAYVQGGITLYPLSYVDGSVSYYVNGILQPTPAVTDAQPLTVTGISVPAGGNALIVYAANVNEFAPLAAGSTVINTASITGGGLTQPVTATETITAAEGAQLSIIKSLSPDVVEEDGQLTYTFVIRNFGNAPIVATDNAVVSDLFNPILDPITVTFNGAVWAEGTNYTYDTATGLFVTSPGPITVPAATFAQDPVTGVWTVTPGVSTLIVTGTV
jgi:uncharacterized repeat protein (TIGR01451 family)